MRVGLSFSNRGTRSALVAETDVVAQSLLEGRLCREKHAPTPSVLTNHAFIAECHGARNETQRFRSALQLLT